MAKFWPEITKYLNDFHLFVYMKIIVIGGGAAGFFSAINIAEKNIEIGKEIFHQLQKRKKVSDLAKLISRIKR